MHFLDGIKDEDMNQIAGPEVKGRRYKIQQRKGNLDMKETYERTEQNGGDCVII
jgi:hypothetical protein